MNELANTKAQSNLPDRLTDLANQAQMFAQNACMNLLQLGRVLSEARPLIPHGDFDRWCRENAKMSRRTAEQYMQAYAEFGLNTKIAELGTSKIIKLLPMSSEEREKLMAENDVPAMSTRQLDAAIREQRERLYAEARADAQAEIDAANQRIRELENRGPEIPDELLEELKQGKADLKSARDDVHHFAEIAQKINREKFALSKERDALQADLAEAEQSIQEQQEALNRAQEELLSLQSAQARGESGRVGGDELTLDIFSAAVREFVGQCARMPYMNATFAAMNQRERAKYTELLKTVEGWCRQSRLALDSVAVDGGVLVG